MEEVVRFRQICSGERRKTLTDPIFNNNDDTQVPTGVFLLPPFCTFVTLSFSVRYRVQKALQYRLNYDDSYIWYLFHVWVKLTVVYFSKERTVGRWKIFETLRKVPFKRQVWLEHEIELVHAWIRYLSRQHRLSVSTWSFRTFVRHSRIVVSAEPLASQPRDGMAARACTVSVWPRKVWTRRSVRAPPASGSCQRFTVVSAEPLASHRCSGSQASAQTPRLWHHGVLARGHIFVRSQIMIERSAEAVASHSSPPKSKQVTIAVTGPSWLSSTAMASAAPSDGFHIRAVPSREPLTSHCRLSIQQSVRMVSLWPESRQLHASSPD